MTLVRQSRTWNVFREAISFVGVIPEPRHTPFSSFNIAIHYIRHAVSLDETSPKFELQLYRYKDLTIASEAKKKEIRKKNNAELQAGYPNHEGFTDLKEVWFAGSHYGKLPSE